jgi:hypothetical protein
VTAVLGSETEMQISGMLTDSATSAEDELTETRWGKQN